MVKLAAEQVRRLRMRAQGFYPQSTRETVTGPVRAVVGIQAQLVPAMILALRARVSGLEAGNVAEAIDHHRRLVRTWAMRGTLHLLASTDVRWLVSLLGPTFLAGGKGRRLALGLDEDTCTR